MENAYTDHDQVFRPENCDVVNTLVPFGGRMAQ